MSFNINLDLKKLEPTKKFWIQAIYIGAWATFIEFLLFSTGIGFILKFIPDLLKTLFIVAVSIYLARIISIKSDGNEVI